MSENVAKSMAYITNGSGGYIQQGGWLFKPTSEAVTFNGYPSTSGCLTGLRNKPQGITPNVENNEARSKPQASGNSL